MLSAILLGHSSAAQEVENLALKIGTIVGDHVNVRGKPTLASEVVTRLQKGEKVTILEELAPQKLKDDEPTRWYRIVLPQNTPVWVHSGFLDESSSTALQRLNLRAGAGENYSVLGRIEKGTPVKEFRRKEEWAEIEAPPEAYAFVAADLVEYVGGMIAKSSATQTIASESPKVAQETIQTPPKAAAATAEKTAAAENPPPSPPKVAVPVSQPTESETEVVVVPEPTPVAASPAPPAAVSTTPAAIVPTSPAAPDSTKAPDPQAAIAPRVDGLRPISGAATNEGKPTRRIVIREGLVGGTFFDSIQAPTFFALRTLQDGRLMNYLHAGKLDIKLESFKGRKVLVTGEEFMDRRWAATPVLEVESIDLIP